MKVVDSFNSINSSEHIIFPVLNLAVLTHVRRQTDSGR